MIDKKIAVVRLYTEQVNDRRLLDKLKVFVFNEDGTKATRDELNKLGSEQTSSLASRSLLLNQVESIRKQGYLVLVIDELLNKI